MQSRFLPLYHDLKSDKAIPMHGLWLAHSDEPIALDWLIDACRPRWQRDGKLIKRLELTSAKSWHDVLSELNALSLFDDGMALILTGKHKPDAKDKPLMDGLARFASDATTGATTNHLIWCLPKQDKKSLTTKSLKLFDTHGLIIDAHIYNEEQRRQLLMAKCAEFGLMLEQDVWQSLLTHTEHNLLSAYQTLWRLSYLYPPATTIDADMLMTSLVDGSTFDVFHLSDTLITGDCTKALQIISHLQNIDTPPSIVLWALAKDARLIAQIQAGKDPSTLGIWSNKIYSYQQAARRCPPIDYSTPIYEIDKAIKGVSNVSVWGQIRRFVQALCGIYA